MAEWPQQPLVRDFGDSLKVSSDRYALYRVWQYQATYSQARQLSSAGMHAFLQVFALVILSHNLAGVVVLVEGIPRQDLPVIEHILGKGLAISVGTPQVSSAYFKEGEC